MKVLLTGAAGNLGRAIIRTAQQGDEIVAVDLNQPDEPISSVADVHWHDGSYANRDLLAELLTGCDVVMHTAAAHPGNTKADQRDAYVDLNVKALDVMYRLMVDRKVPRMVYSSSAEVVIGASWSTNGAAVIGEDTHSYAFDSVYNMTKAMGETAGRYWSQTSGLQVAMMRYMAFAGAVRPKAGTELIAREMCPDDVARANWLAARCENMTADVFNIGPDCPLSSRDVVTGLSDPEAAIEKHYPGAVERLKAAKYGIRRNLFPVLRTDKARQILGWHPQYTFAAFLDTLDVESS